MFKNRHKTVFIIEILIGIFSLLTMTYLKDSIPLLYVNIIFFFAYILLGFDVFKNAFLDIKRGKFLREAFLMTIATIGAIAINEYPEAIAVLIFYKVGIYFESRATNKSKNTILSLMALREDYANLLKDGVTTKTYVKDVKIGDIIDIYPFEKVPLDSVIVKGSTWFDTKTLTGESMPKVLHEGEEILSGMINGESSVRARVIRDYDNSSITKILNLVQNVQGRKAKVEKFVSTFSSIYTPIVLSLAILMVLIPSILYGREGFDTWFVRALTLLVVACPCAFVVGIPLTYFAAIGYSSKKGIMVKGGIFFDLMSKIKTIVFDKTGTLTKGEFSVKEIIKTNLLTDEEFLRYSAYAESQSHHPIAKSIVSFYESRYGKIKSDTVVDYKDIGGRGIVTKIEGNNILIGGDKLMKEYNIDMPNNLPSDMNVYMAVNGVYVGGYIIDDTIKEDTKEAIDSLTNMGVKTALLSGDKTTRVEAFVKEVGIDLAVGDCLPEDKVYKFESIIKDSKIGVFVGDGINDAPCLARAEVGIAMGGLGSDAALENADVVIMDDKPSKVALLINIAKKTRIIVWQNLLLAFLVKFAVIALGIFGLASMWMAIFADTGVTTIVVFNAIRILYPLGEKVNKTNITLEDAPIKCSCEH